MIIRELPFEEWDKLEGLPFVEQGYPNPTATKILVVESSDGQILGLWSAMGAIFLEGLWVHPDHRGHSTIAGRLLHGMKGMLQDMGVHQTFTMTQTDEVKQLAYKAGFESVPGDVLVLNLEHIEAV